MLNPRLAKVQDALLDLEAMKDLGSAKKVIHSVIELLLPELKAETKDLFRIYNDKDGKLKANSGWFQSDDVIADRLAVYSVDLPTESNLDVKVFAVNKANKGTISWAVGLTPNFEDEPFNGRYNVGIDFVIPNSKDRVIMALSKNYVIRTIELRGRLTATFLEILSSWINISDTSRKAEFHSLLWNSLDLSPINKRFYEGISQRFVLLRQFLESENILDKNQAAQFANRLIGRVIFAWFLDKKNFINEDQRYFDPILFEDNTEYYKTKLEVLFFDVLNVPVEARTSSDRSTPYLNGGLFEAKAGDLYKLDTLVFPTNYFDDLFSFLKTYNFTTDESSSEFQQVAIDPEMLGRIFENLLAEVNEETGEMARRAKGAYYTPRTIVDFMCKESLRVYLRKQLGEIEHLERSLYQLIDATEREFQDQDSNWRRDLKPFREAISSALEKFKIIDPACGSGAFPIGMLQLLFKVYSRIETRFDPYKTKLSIIESNIFGVDIEPMAVEISRLRAWLALIVDDRSNASNVRPLPNLDFNFVCANTLVPLLEEDLLSDPRLQATLNSLRLEYFSANSPMKKNSIQKRYFELTKPSLFDGFDDRSAQLKTFNPFDSHQTASFFDADYMFGQVGFDVVIGNPPYEVLEGTLWKTFMDQVRRIPNYRYALGGRLNLYRLFIERSCNFLKTHGTLSFIVPSTLISDKNTSGIRRMFRNEGTLDFLIEFPEKEHVFESVTQATTIFQFELEKNKKNSFGLSVGLNSALLPPVDVAQLNWTEVEAISGEDLSLPLIKSNEELQLLELLKKGSVPLGEVASCYKGDINLGYFKSSLSDTPTQHLLVRGEHVRPYFVDTSFDNLDRRWIHLEQQIQNSELPRVLLQNVANMGLSQRVKATLLDPGIIVADSCNCVKSTDDRLSDLYLVGLLNSKLINWYFKKFSTNNHVNVYELEALPIKFPSETQVSEIGELVKQCMRLTNNLNFDGGRVDQNTLRERLDRIDEVIFEIYGVQKASIPKFDFEN